MRPFRHLLMAAASVAILSMLPAHAADLAAARAQAHAGVPAFLATWKAQPAGVGGYRVLARVQAGGQSEDLWLDDFKAEGAGFSAVLQAAPRVLKGLGVGQKVTFTAADIDDWSYEDQAIGKLRGNHLQCAELRDLPKAEYEEQLDYLGLACPI